MLKLGVDVGGVLLCRKTIDKKTRKKGSESSWIPCAQESLKSLSEIYELFIVSFCSAKMLTRSKEQLRRLNVDQYVPEDHWFFVTKRTDKSQVCKEQKLNALIDDRLDVLDAVKKEVPHVKRYWFNGDKSQSKHHIVLRDWSHAVGLLKPTN
jgi:hypothetical protein